MEAQRRLLQEWDEEIDKLEQSIAYLRREYVKYKNQLTINNGQLTIINQHSKTKKNGRLK